LASLPESYSVLVTALEASADVPSLAVVRECLHEETKIKGKESQSSQEGVLMASFKRNLQCHLCSKTGHFKKCCDKVQINASYEEDQDGGF